MPSEELDEEIKHMLLNEEEILFQAKQARLKPGGAILTPDKIYITNRRVIYKGARMFGLKADIHDILYDDVSNIRLKRGILSTAIVLRTRFNSDDILLPAVHKSEAQQISSMIQKGMRGELPRQVLSVDRDAPRIEKTHESSMEKLEKLVALKEKGVITEDEFSKMKSDLMKML